jgi:hypothetical protein
MLILGNSKQIGKYNDYLYKLLKEVLRPENQGLKV